jgi:hypothetical protein
MEADKARPRSSGARELPDLSSLPPEVAAEEAAHLTGAMR